MRSSKTGHLRFDRASALILMVFAGGSVLDALLRMAQLAGPGSHELLKVMTAVVPVLIATGVWTALRSHKELSGACFITLMVAIALGFTALGSTIPISWYPGAGLIIWSMRLGQNLLMWVGTSLLVLAAGAQFNLIDYTGVLYLPFVITVPVFLCAAAYFQWHQVRVQAQEIDLDAMEAKELHLRRYGRLPNE